MILKRNGRTSFARPKKRGGEKIEDNSRIRVSPEKKNKVNYLFLSIKHRILVLLLFVWKR